MDSGRSKVVILVAPEAPDPPALDTVTETAEATVVRTADELAAALPAADVLVVYDFNSTLVHDLGTAVKDLEWIHAASAGVDAVLTPDVVEAGILVTNSAGVFERPIAEYVLGLLLAFCTDLPRTLRLQAEGRWEHRDTLPFAARRVLVVGAGSIGTEVGRLTRAAGAEVRGIATRRRDDPVFGEIQPVTDLHGQLGWADDVVVCLPLTDATRGLFDAAAFAAMRSGSTFVNIGRGPVVDEVALVATLDSGHVRAAGLDVFATEPLPDDHPLWAMDQVVVSPHMSGDNVGWEAELTRRFADNLRRWTAGEPVDHVIQGDAR